MKKKVYFKEKKIAHRGIHEKYLENTIPAFKEAIKRGYAIELDIQFTKEQASALMGVATTAIKDYLKIGRKLVLPVTASDEARMEMYCDIAPERINQNRFAKTEEEKKKVSKTLARTVLKSKNSTPSWLRLNDK